LLLSKVEITEDAAGGIAFLAIITFIFFSVFGMYVSDKIDDHFKNKNK
jgi:hypothetical protein